MASSTESQKIQQKSFNHKKIKNFKISMSKNMIFNLHIKISTLAVIVGFKSYLIFELRISTIRVLYVYTP